MSGRKLNILVSPLNWGLGHAVRCIPLIKTLEKLGHSIFIASNGSALSILEKEFPHIKSINIPGFNLKYPTRHLGLNVLLQSPHIIWKIYAEQKACNKVVSEEKIDLIISDNRYGIRSKQCPSVFMSHQIKLISPFPILEKWINWWNRRQILKFDSLWIPDVPDKVNLSGKLAHNISVPATYLGVLSRFKQNIQHKLTIDAAFILSGPEPQRRYFEEKILDQIEKLKGHFILVRGVIDDQAPIPAHSENITVYNYLLRQELNEVIIRSKYIVCRSGYTSILDMAAMQKKCLLVPTPGQTEQIYLARHLASQAACLYQNQTEFDLYSGLEQLNHIDGFSGMSIEKINLEKVLEKEISQITVNF